MFKKLFTGLVVSFLFLISVQLVYSQNYAMEFTGPATTYIRIPDSTSLDLQGVSGFTFEMFIYITQMPLGNGDIDCGAIFRFVCGGSPGSHLQNVLLRNDGGLWLRFGWEPADGSNEWWQYTVSQTWSLNTWYHIAVTFNQSDRSFRVYRDGVQIGTTQTVPGTAGLLNCGQNNNRYIGGQGFDWSGPNQFYGRIDEVRISNIARSTTSTFPVPTQPYTADANTVALWHLDDSGTTAVDSSANGNNGTIVGATTRVPGYTFGGSTPTITVTQPNTAVSWQATTVQTVNWTWTGTVNNVNIDLSTNGGSSWTNLVQNTLNDGTETITIPNTPSTSCRIRVSETDGTPSDISDVNFTITAPPAPQITVTSPNGGENWQTGSVQTVIWTTQGVVNNVNIDLSTNNGSSWTNLVQNTPNDGSQTVTVPNTPSASCLIRVQETDGDPTDNSNGVFTISVAPMITVTSPNGGETWTVNSQVTVTWTTQGTVNNVNIDLSTNGGSTWTNLVQNTLNDGNQTVTVPNTPSTSCRIRVAETDGTPSDMSDANFTIASGPTITVASPNGGEQWEGGSVQTVLWSSAGGVNNVNIDLSTDGGSSWTNLVQNTLNDGTETITVPNTPSTTCRIRVAETDGTPSDSSDSDFIITAPPAPVLLLGVTSLNFSKVAEGTKKTLKFNISNTGGAVLTGTITSNKNWILVDPASFSVNSGQSVVISVTVDNSILKKMTGSYSGTLNVNSNGGTGTVSISMTATCVIATPNPYNPNAGELKFSGDGIVAGETVLKIYAVSGELIKELKATSDEIIWDGKDINGKMVSDGIYIYTYVSPKEKGVGKITVIK